jgi:hypothetical protein
VTTRDTIYLVISPRKVERMTKTVPEMRHGEIVVKLVVEVPPGRFRTPTVERRIVIEDWADGTELGDLELRRDFITEAEAKLIVERRLAQMAEILRERGYSVTPGPAAGNEVPDAG